MYQALYRKWRPQTFDDVIGQKHITDSLKNQVQTGHLSHAYIFIGTRGTGKTTCARILAKAVNCDHPVNGNPCGECPSCRAISQGSVMDIVELDAASNNGVDNVRALREEAVFSPADLKKRVYIIDEVHMLSTSAFNALLKILEEPPEHLMFILATTELQKVPATILSRCQRHSFRRIDSQMLTRYLLHIAERESISLSEDAAALIAGLAEGGVRDALSMLDQCSAYGNIGTDEVYASVGLAGNKRTIELFDRICEQNAAETISLFNDLWSEGKDPASLLRELSGLVRDILMLKVAPRNASELIYGGYNREVLKEYASRFTVRQLSGTLETLQDALGKMRDRLNPKMTVELCLITLCSNAAGGSLQALGERIEALEKGLKNGTIAVRSVEVRSPVSGDAPRPVQAPAAVPEAENETAEEQPDGPEETETAPAGEPSQQNSTDMGADELWSMMAAKCKTDLPRDIGMTIGSTVKHTIRENGSLILEAEPGLLYDRINRPEILEKLSGIASEEAGTRLTVKIRHWKREARPPRDLNELRQFSEVRFINS